MTIHFGCKKEISICIKIWSPVIRHVKALKLHCYEDYCLLGCDTVYSGRYESVRITCCLSGYRQWYPSAKLDIITSEKINFHSHCHENKEKYAIVG
jgi:hypothetical protein